MERNRALDALKILTVFGISVLAIDCYLKKIIRIYIALR